MPRVQCIVHSLTPFSVHQYQFEHVVERAIILLFFLLSTAWRSVTTYRILSATGLFNLRQTAVISLSYSSASISPLAISTVTRVFRVFSFLSVPLDRDARQSSTSYSNFCAISNLAPFTATLSILGRRGSRLCVAKRSTSQVLGARFPAFHWSPPVHPSFASNILEQMHTVPCGQIIVLVSSHSPRHP